MTIAHRPIEAPDRRFVVDAWCRSFQHSDTAGMISPARWFGVMICEVERILGAPDVETIVAYEPRDTGRLADLYGFIVFDRSAPPPIVFYVYVKSVYRRAGIARGLFAAAGIDPSRLFLYACTNGIVSALVQERVVEDELDLDNVRVIPPKLPFAVWNPHLARFAIDGKPRDILQRRDR